MKQIYFEGTRGELYPIKVLYRNHNNFYGVEFTKDSGPYRKGEKTEVNGRHIVHKAQRRGYRRYVQQVDLSEIN